MNKNYIEKNRDYIEKEYYKYQADNDRMWERIKEMEPMIRQIAYSKDNEPITDKTYKQCIKAVLLTLISKWDLESMRDDIYISENKR